MRRPPEREGYCPLLRFHHLPVSLVHKTWCAGHTGVVPPGEEDPYYMSGCNVWTANPDQIADKPGCSYTFEWSDV